MCLCWKRHYLSLSNIVMKRLFSCEMCIERAAFLIGKPYYTLIQREYLFVFEFKELSRLSIFSIFWVCHEHYETSHWIVWCVLILNEKCVCACVRVGILKYMLTNWNDPQFIDRFVSAICKGFVYSYTGYGQLWHGIRWPLFKSSQINQRFYESLAQPFARFEWIATFLVELLSPTRSSNEHTRKH